MLQLSLRDEHSLLVQKSPSVDASTSEVSRNRRKVVLHCSFSYFLLWVPGISQYQRHDAELDEYLFWLRMGTFLQSRRKRYAETVDQKNLYISNKEKETQRPTRVLPVCNQYSLQRDYTDGSDIWKCRKCISIAEPFKENSSQGKGLFRSCVAQIFGRRANVSACVSHPAQGNFMNQFPQSNSLLHECMMLFKWSINKLKDITSTSHMMDGIEISYYEEEQQLLMEEK